MHITFETTLGRITIGEEGHAVSRLYFADQLPNYSVTEKPSLFLRQAAWEIREVLGGKDARALHSDTRGRNVCAQGSVGANQA